MSRLFLKTLSQGLQAFLPVAASLVWCQAVGAQILSSAIRRGLVVSIPMSFVGAWLFRTSARQSLDQALLTVFAVAMTLVAAQLLPRHDTRSPQARETGLMMAWAVAVASCVMVVRQTMEVVWVLQIAAVEARSLDATASIAIGVMIAGAITWLCAYSGRLLPAPLLLRAMWTLWAAFLSLSLLYAFHEFSEARLLPWSEILHTATEPYGPDGLYGVHFSDVLVVAPLVAVAWTWGWARVRMNRRTRPWLRTDRRLATMTILLFACVLMGLQQTDARPPQAPIARPEDVAAMAARPHVLFRETVPGPSFGRLTLAALDAPNGERLSTGLTCERLSFAAGRGLCLHLQRGVFNVYTAVQFDGSLKTGGSIKLEGLPSRTRVAADGRVGAVTVFVFGDDYASSFSTRTTLLDLSSGDQIGELEEFATWRDGARIRAADFNFWGVTFTHDANIFYAAMKTGGLTFLVRGELALRKLTVLRENVECPSLSPDERLLAYKKRVGPSPDSWRLHVLDLQTNVERIIPGETRFIDDQVEWLDGRRVLYGVPRRTTSVSDVWVVPIDGSEPARIFLPQAESPIVVR